MLFANLNIETKILRIISLIVTFIGIVFILASNYVGNFAIRISMIVIFVISIFNFKMTYEYSKMKERINMIFTLIGSFAVFLRPSLTMFIIGIALLVISVPFLFKAIKNKDYSDKLMLILSSAGTLFAIYCIINSRAALNTVIIIIGIAFVILGCLMFFETYSIERKSNKFATYDYDKKNKAGFEKPEDVDFYN